MDLAGEVSRVAGIADPELAGEGGFGVVFRARQDSLGREVAVKVGRRAVSDAAERARFEAECRAVGRLSAHPNVVSVHASGFTVGGLPYLVMDYLPGGSLADRLDASGPLPWTEVLACGSQVGDALAAAHAAGLLHRDLKPENVLIDRFGTPVLVDFGLAQVGEGHASDTTAPVVSLVHAAPELLVDGAAPTPLSDVYALGSTLYALLAGAAPFWRDGEPTVFPLLARVAAEDVPDLRRRGVPAPVCEVVEQALAKDPAQRPPDAASMSGACRQAAVGLGADPDLALPAADPRATIPVIAAQPPAPGVPIVAIRRRRRAVGVIAGAAVVLAGVIGVGLLLGGSNDDNGAAATVTTGRAEPTAPPTPSTTVATTEVPVGDPPTTGSVVDGRPVELVPPVASLDTFPDITAGAVPAGADAAPGLQLHLQPSGQGTALLIGTDQSCRGDDGSVPTRCVLAHGTAGWFAMAQWNAEDGPDCNPFTDPGATCPEIVVYAQDGEGGRFRPFLATDFTGLGYDVLGIDIHPFTSGGEQALAAHSSTGGATTHWGALEVVTWSDGPEPVLAAAASAETNDGVPQAHQEGILLVGYRGDEVLDLRRHDDGTWWSVAL